MRTLLLTTTMLLALGSAAAAAAAAPTLKASARVVPFGKSLVLSGSGGAGTVQLLAQPCGFTGASAAQQTRAGADGSFRFAFEPAITAVYSVKVGDATSAQVRVLVRPAVQIQRVGAGRFSVQVAVGGGNFFTGKTVLVQRAVRGTWHSVGSAPLKQASSNTSLTAISAATVVAKAPRGSRVRALFPARQAAPCYGGAVSPVVSA